MKIESLQNKHKGQDIVVLTCGPSLKEYSHQTVANFCKDKVVLCVKEAIIEFKDICDYFIQNETRYRKYEFNEKTIKILQNKSGKFINDGYDIILDEARPFTKSNQLLMTKDFNQYDLNNKTKRPWGPGILYESVFYLCKYMGVRNIYTIGWDLIDPKSDKVITHYFDKSTETKYSKSYRWTVNDTNQHEFLKEMVFVNNNIFDLYQYLIKSNVYITVVGHQSHVDRKIPRIYLEIKDKDKNQPNHLVT